MRCLCSRAGAPSIRRRMKTPCLLCAARGVVHSPWMRVTDQAGPSGRARIGAGIHCACPARYSPAACAAAQVWNIHQPTADDAAAIRTRASEVAGKMARVTSEVEMVVEAFARSAAVLLLPMLVLACIVSDSGPVATLGVWLTWMVLALGIDAVSPRVGRTRAAAGSTIKALVFTAPLLQGAVLVYALWIVSATPKAPMTIAMIAVMVGISAGAVGISAAHELVHRRGSLERGIAQAFMLLVSYPHFPIVHLRVHHAYVGTPLDPGTSRLNEPLVHFVGRAFVLAWHSGWRVESSRLARKGLTPWRMDNAILRALTLQAAVYVALGTAFGWIG